MPLFDAEGRLSTDPCYVHTRDHENENAATYNITNLRPDGGACCPNVKRDPLLDVAVKHRNLNTWAGYGWNTCTINDDSRLRLRSTGTNPRGKQQLSKRVFEAGPSLVHGELAVDTDSRLREGMDTAPLNECSRLSERDFKRFTPGVCQPGVDHIVPTMWINGGASSREISRSDEFLRGMGYRYDGRAWRRVR
jgi:hypothetical protein